MTMDILFLILLNMFCHWTIFLVWKSVCVKNPLSDDNTHFKRFLSSTAKRIN